MSSKILVVRLNVVRIVVAPVTFENLDFSIICLRLLCLIPVENYAITIFVVSFFFYFALSAAPMPITLTIDFKSIVFCNIRLIYFLFAYFDYALPTTVKYPPTRDIFALIGLLLDYPMQTPLQSVPIRDPSSNRPTQVYGTLCTPAEIPTRAVLNTYFG